ncbi:MAG: hypothetical protein RR053_08355 [Evtepia sp.]
MVTPLDLTRRTFRASLGLFIFAFGDYLTICAGIGLAPWEVFCMGLSYHWPLSFGITNVLISLTIVAIDLMLHERIGLGTILDAFIVGLGIDLFNWLNLVPKITNVWFGLAIMTLGLLIMSFAQYLYMSAGLCCGPRDSLLVAIGKRLRKVPIGAVEILILVAVLLVGRLLGGPIGIGTVYATVGAGVSMQFVFHLLHFEPRSVVHIGFGGLLSRFQKQKT